MRGLDGASRRLYNYAAIAASIRLPVNPIHPPTSKDTQNVYHQRKNWMKYFYVIIF